MALNVFDAVRASNKADNLAEWGEHNPEAAEIVTWVKRLRDAND